MAEKMQFTLIERALADGYAEITGEGKNERIRYPDLYWELAPPS